LVRAKQLLFTDVSDAFYLLKSHQEDFSALQDIGKALQERITELKRRESLGRSRPSEVASTEVKLYQNEAEMESVSSQRDVARELLEFLIGKPIVSIAGGDIADGFGPREDYLAKADLRPDAQAAREALTVAQKKIAIARAGYFPAVDIVGNSYIKRAQSFSSGNWDISLNITVPIFNGTQTAGAVKEARALAQEARLRLNQTRRQAGLDIENAHTRLSAYQKQGDAYKKALSAAQKNYELQMADYRNNLVNNLDVLQALEDMQDARRKYISIKNQAQRLYWALKVATGDIDDDAF
ncbi:MAG: TolC family protein, partial [Candidatus Omnitrophica bacterium]|nr:TolC family protein [Candidatus Omnitrophota bacterium]